MPGRRYGVVALMGLLLTGCAGSESLVDRVAGSGRVAGDADRVVIHGMASAADALPFAIAHCSHFQKSAQYERHDVGDYTYRCIAR